MAQKKRAKRKIVKQNKRTIVKWKKRRDYTPYLVLVAVIIIGIAIAYYRYLTR